MVRLSLVNLYLHGFTDPHIFEYDTLTSQDRWNEYHIGIIYSLTSLHVAEEAYTNRTTAFRVQSKLQRSAVLRGLHGRAPRPMVAPASTSYLGIFQSLTAQLRKISR